MLLVGLVRISSRITSITRNITSISSISKCFFFNVEKSSLICFLPTFHSFRVFFSLIPFIVIQDLGNSTQMKRQAYFDNFFQLVFDK